MNHELSDRIRSPSFPVDLVYTWVDGSDVEWMAKRSQYQSQPHNRSIRWKNQQELRYSLRSAYWHSPWIRRIFIVTDKQVPSWLNLDHPQVCIVDHRDIFRWLEDLPTFNSHAIECHLHRIPGLSEHFLYANDDTFFGCQSIPEDFFTLDGKIVVGAGMSRLPQHLQFPASFVSGGVVPAISKAVQLLAEAFPDCEHLYPVHQIKPYTIELFQYAEARWPWVFRECSRNRFRGEGDVSLNFGLLHPLALKTGRGVLSRIREGFFGPSTQASVLACHEVLKEREYKLICINDDSEDGLELEGLLSSLWPVPCPFEIGAEK